MPATNTAMNTAIATTKTVTVGSDDANGKLSNRAYHAAGTAAFWWLRDETAGAFVDLGGRFRGDRDFAVQVELTVGHSYVIGAGRGSDAVRGEFDVE